MVVVARVVVAAATIGALSTLTVRHELQNRLDRQLLAASHRGDLRRHGDGKRPAAPPPAASTTLPTGTTAPDAAPQEEPQAEEPDDDRHKYPLPAGLDAPGQSAGTLTLITSGTGDTSTITAGYIDPDGHHQPLSRAQSASLLALPADGRPTTVWVKGLGRYRVLSYRDQVSGSTVVTGLSTGPDEGVVQGQLLLELAIVLVGAGVVGLVGRGLVRTALAPLERVAGTAQRVASQRLDAGEVSIHERVPDTILATSAELGQVGGALNTLLDHVDEALAAHQRSENHMRQFLADASHELRTPLASIRGYTELIEREGAAARLPEEARHALERVHSESLRMTALVEDLLLLARLDAGRELAHEEVDLVGLLVDSVADAQVAGPGHRWALDLQAIAPPPGATAAELETFEPEPALVCGDEARLRQVLVNLLTNARTHTPAGSLVTTTLTRAGQDLVVQVSDDGPGIAPPLRERLFERFARGDSSRERRTGSTGLGLSIAQAIVRSHQGSLSVSACCRGEDPAAPERHGTVFTLRLPAAAPEE